jgi:CDP-diglyceride synthetase
MTLLIPSLWKRVQFEHDDPAAWWRQDNDDNSLLFRLLFGLALSSLAILGDLTESMVKRRAHTKDANKYVLPGHGGVLDRFDSTLLSVVLYYAVVQTMN